MVGTNRHERYRIAEVASSQMNFVLGKAGLPIHEDSIAYAAALRSTTHFR